MLTFKAFAYVGWYCVDALESRRTLGRPEELTAHWGAQTRVEPHSPGMTLLEVGIRLCCLVSLEGGVLDLPPYSSPASSLSQCPDKIARFHTRCWLQKATRHGWTRAAASVGGRTSGLRAGWMAAQTAARTTRPVGVLAMCITHGQQTGLAQDHMQQSVHGPAGFSRRADQPRRQGSAER